MATWIKPITAETASAEAKEIIDKYKIDLNNCSHKTVVELNNPTVFKCVELNAWDMDDEVKKKVGGRYADIIEASVSWNNHSVICTNAYARLLKDRYDIDIKNDPDFARKFDAKDQVVWDLGAAIAKDIHSVGKDLQRRLKEQFTDEQIIVLVGMASITEADNTFESVMDIE
ncbi:MAG: hypothetical protein LKG56_00595 [Lachnospiraceae bacterium]|jgi:alkylhydroperoxidase family enzyme|nr:hypothetical protein [Lachnospiraceae bacterium]MCH4030189.1 hypothetical protein [Lachnospiraceae bacterium]MCH4069401.1 hypothetical protein [Lachnospiraceae bacterium]MCH4107663.1 hypothetical protein [Lachnospiraceae bacterium]MCI1301486.1 hypothetical protein [Lachnospiraceae bacterium]